MTGAELRAWREKLGKDEAWALSVCGDARGPGLSDSPGEQTIVSRLRLAEGEEIAYSGRDRATLRKALAAALEAEESRQRAQAEPVCPEGVTVRHESGYAFVDRAGHVRADGSVSTRADMCADRVALRYLVDLADHRARLHAEGDRQRKLDAVRAAEEAHGKARDAVRDAEKALDCAFVALTTARREAGL